MIRWWILLSLSLTACSLFQKEVDISPLPPKPDIRAEQEKALGEAETEYQKKNFKLSYEKFDQFIKRYPQSIFLAQAHLGVAKNFMSTSQYQKAADSFRTVVNLTHENQPDISASAVYSSSYCYEMLGDDARLMATLKDAERLQSYLPDDVRLAELPARLASIHYKFGRKLEADQYFQIADRGMVQLKARSNSQLSKVWVSKTYFQMGGLTTSQLSAETVPSHLESLTSMQYFILRAIEEDGEPWAGQALSNLKRNYLDLWNTIMAWPKDPTLDPIAAQKTMNQTQGKLLSDMMTTIERLRALIAPESQEKNKKVADLLVFLNELEIKSRDFIYSAGVYNELTPEAKQRSGLKREGVIRAK